MTWARRSGCRGCGFALAMFAIMATAAAGPVAEYELKAALLYNFASFTTWPASAPAGMTVCVLGSDPFGPALDALAEKSLRGATVEVRRIRHARDARACHVVFLSEADAKNTAAALDGLQGKPVLTVADGENSVQHGVMIGLRQEGGRLAFDVNTAAVQAAGLVMSSKLLRLARTVHSSP